MGLGHQGSASPVSGAPFPRTRRHSANPSQGLREQPGHQPTASLGRAALNDPGLVLLFLYEKGGLCDPPPLWWLGGADVMLDRIHRPAGHQGRAGEGHHD